MEHSMYSYLQRQSTQVLEVLLRDYGTQSGEEPTELGDMIQEILNERKRQNKKPPLE